MKKLLSVILCAVLLVSVFGAVSVFAEAKYMVSTCEIVSGGYGIISSANADAAGSVSPSAWKYSISVSEKNVENDPVATKGDLIFYKFDVSKIKNDAAFIEKAELSFYLSGMSNQTLRFYPVANDNWETTTLTHNAVFGEGALFTPDTEYVSISTPYIGSHKSAKLLTVDITDILKDDYIKDGVATFAFGINSSSNDNVNNYYVKRYLDQEVLSAPYLSIYQPEPVYDYSGDACSVKYSDHGFIRPTAPDTVHNLISSGTRYEPSNSDFSDPYATDDAVYLKFDLSDVLGEIEKAELNLTMGCLRAWDAAIYPVVNDNWTHADLTFNTAYGREAGEGVEAIESLYAPSNEGFVDFKTIRTNSGTSPVVNTVDITDMVKSLTENDKVVSLAFMLKSTTDNKAFYFFVKESETIAPPTLSIETKPGNVTSEQVKIKIDGVNAESIVGESGVVTAEVNTVSTMPQDTRATMIMAHYEGDKLVKIYTSPQQVIGSKDVNGGNSTLKISSLEPITFTENTMIKAFAWKHFTIQQPLSLSKTISAQ